MTHDLARAPIAIVGVSALTPGATDVAGFWRSVLTGQDLITDVPATHWLVEDYYDPDPETQDKTYGNRGGFLPPVAFDTLAFGMPPSSVAATDTAQLLALVAADQVLADAVGGDLDSLDRERVSVVLGTAPLELLASMSNRMQRPVWIKALREHGVQEARAQAICDSIAGQYVPWQEASFPGLLPNVVAGRIANRFDLHGTNHTVDAGCASSLAALSSAMNELHLGHADMVVTGGVDTLNDILMFMCFSKTPALSPTGDCRPFSDAADGTMLGEGLVMFALKRLADAERDGNAIYAVIRGLGASSDGRSTAIYAPLADGQSRALRRAYQAAGYGPDTVELIEAHGTGTVAGDAAEVAALREVFEASGRTGRQWCALGSVKSQIGHAKYAAGAAGLLKAVLAVQHGILPPTIKVDRPNPRLELGDSPLYLNTQARPWIRGNSHPRRAGVSSFGFGGTNFHVTVEEYAPGPADGQGGGSPGGQAARRVRAMPSELVLLGASTADELVARCGEVAALDQPVARIARGSQREGWQGAPVRLGVVASDATDLADKLAQAAALIAKTPDASWCLPSGIHYGASPADGRLAFLFPGQGSQYVGMGADVAMAYPRARSAWDQAADIALGEQPLHEIVFPPPVFTEADRATQQARLTATEWAQPALAVTSLALLGILNELGITPDCMTGHSFGELVALHAAGAYDQSTLLRLARIRGELMRDAASVPSAMLAVTASAEDAQAILASIGPDELWIANDNGPAQTVLSGTASAIDAAAGYCQQTGITARRLNAAAAFHSPLVAQAAGPLLEFLYSADVRRPLLPVYGNTDAAPYPADPGTVRERIATHLSAPVRFTEQIQAMHAAGVRTFVEVGAGATLTGLVGGILGDRPHLAVSLDHKGRNGVTSLHNALARLAVRGVDMNLEPLWDLYGAAAPPPKPRATGTTLMICGANYGRPYPPASGAAELPAPAQQAHPSPANQVADARAGGRAPCLLSSRDASPPAPSQAPAHPAPLREAAWPAPPQPPPVPQPAPALPSSGPNVGWLRVLQEVHRETAEAHASYQRLMSESHTAFLQMAETSLSRLAAVADDRAHVADLVQASPVHVETPPAPPAPLATPQPENVDALPAGPQPDSAGTWPTASRPGHVAPAIPSVLEYAPEDSAMPTASVAQSPPAVIPSVLPPSPTDLEALVLSAVAGATGYPVDMLSTDMALEADLGIDSLKRVRILSKLREAVPGLPELTAAEAAKFQTPDAIITALQATTVPAPDVPAAAMASAPDLPELTRQLPPAVVPGRRNHGAAPGFPGSARVVSRA